MGYMAVVEDEMVDGKDDAGLEFPDLVIVYFGAGAARMARIPSSLPKACLHVYL